MDAIIPNPFLRGPCFATGRHHTCVGVLYQVFAPPKPGDGPEQFRYRSAIVRCPCQCGHPERSTAGEAPALAPAGAAD